MIIGATLYVMMVTCHHTTFESNGDCHHHFYKVEFAIFRIFLATRSGGPKYAENAIAAGAQPRTPLGELTTLLQTP